MNRWKFRRNSSRLILVLASLVTLIVIVITGVSSYAVTPDTAFAYIVKFQGNGLTLGTGDIRNRQLVSLKDKLEGNKVLYIPGGNKPWAHLGFAVDYPKDFAQLIVKAGPHPDVSEWSFPCTAKGGLTIAWKRGDEKACKEGVKLQSSSKKSGLPNNNLQASRRLLAQAEDEVTVVPTPGESVIQTADNAAGIKIDVLVGEVQVKSAKNPGGRLVKAGERYNYPQDTITPIDTNPIVNSPEMQDFLNPNNWLSPDIPQRIANGFSEQLGEMQTALNQLPQQTASQSIQPQRTAIQSTQPQPQAENANYTEGICSAILKDGQWQLASGGPATDLCEGYFREGVCARGGNCQLIGSTYLLYGQNQVLVSCEGYNQTFIGIGREPIDQAVAAVSGPNNFKLRCTFRVIGSPPEPPQPITP